MISRGRVLMVALAVSAAVAWALGLVVLQPLSEPVGFDALGNNTYWARELRWGALLALVLSMIALSGARSRAMWSIVAGGCAWLAVDVFLDRLDIGHGATWLVAGAATVALVGCAVVNAVSSARRAETSRSVAIVAAVAAGLATATESPTDTGTGLDVGSAVVGSLLALVAVVAAAGRRRVPVGVPLAAAAVPWLLRFVPMPIGVRWLLVLAFTVLLVVALATLHAGRPGIVAAIAAIILPATLVPLILASVILQPGKPFTLLAANPPIEIDEDVILIVLAIPVGIVLDRVLRALSPEPGMSDGTAPANLSRQ